MDNVDVSILKELTKDPQIPFLRIAEETGVSPRTVQRKYQKMKDTGIILRSSIIIDLSKIGYQGKAYLHITNAPGQEKAVTINALKKIPNMFMITEIIGEFDVLAIAAVRSFISIMENVNAIRKLPSVDRVEVTFVTDTMFPGPKEFNELFPPEKTNDKSSAQHSRFI
jgi:Lrp/AsnC family transcriptional regulator for asnA, asnC and gidA